MSGIMDRLFPEVYDFGGAEHREASQTASRLRKELLHTLEPAERSLLDRLQSAMSWESGAEIRGAYRKGFFDGMTLMLEYCRQCEGLAPSGTA